LKLGPRQIFMTFIIWAAHVLHRKRQIEAIM